MHLLLESREIVEALIQGDVYAETEAVVKVGSVQVIVTKEKKNPIIMRKILPNWDWIPEMHQSLLLKLAT